MSVATWIKDLVWPDGAASFSGLWFWVLLYLVHLAFAVWLV